MSLNIRIVKKILYRGAAPLYCLEEKGWFGRWKSVSYERYERLSNESAAIRNKWRAIHSTDYEYVKNLADTIVTEYRAKLAGVIDKDLGFKETAEVVAEYSTDTVPSKWL